jgi:hypothetical protein
MLWGAKFDDEPMVHEAELVALRKRRQPVLVKAIKCNFEASRAEMGLMETIDIRSVSSGDEFMIMWVMSRRQ